MYCFILLKKRGGGVTLIAICDRKDLNNYRTAINVCIFQDDYIQIIM